jgi:hypothetical protein
VAGDGPVVVAGDADRADATEQRDALAGVGVVPHDVAEAEDPVHALHGDASQRSVQRFEVGMDVRNDR